MLRRNNNAIDNAAMQQSHIRGAWFPGRLPGGRA
jgi:hypothetical protein